MNILLLTTSNDLEFKIVGSKLYLSLNSIWKVKNLSSADKKGFHFHVYE